VRGLFRNRLKNGHRLYHRIASIRTPLHPPDRTGVRGGAISR
jgi:hypothetical protein